MSIELTHCWCSFYAQCGCWKTWFYAIFRYLNFYTTATLQNVTEMRAACMWSKCNNSHQQTDEMKPDLRCAHRNCAAVINFVYIRWPVSRIVSVYLIVVLSHHYTLPVHQHFAMVTTFWESKNLQYKRARTHVTHVVAVQWRLTQRAQAENDSMRRRNMHGSSREWMATYTWSY